MSTTKPGEVESGVASLKLCPFKNEIFRTGPFKPKPDLNGPPRRMGTVGCQAAQPQGLKPGILAAFNAGPKALLHPTGYGGSGAERVRSGERTS